MSRKAKYTVAQKVKAAERYIRGEASASDIAAEMGMPASGKKKVWEWAAAYRENAALFSSPSGRVISIRIGKVINMIEIRQTNIIEDKLKDQPEKNVIH